MNCVKNCFSFQTNGSVIWFGGTVCNDKRVNEMRSNCIASRVRNQQTAMSDERQSRNR